MQQATYFSLASLISSRLTLQPADLTFHRSSTCMVFVPKSFCTAEIWCVQVVTLHFWAICAQLEKGKRSQSPVPDPPQDTVGPPGCLGTADSFSAFFQAEPPDSSISFPSVSIHPGLPCPRCRIWYFCSTSYCCCFPALWYVQVSLWGLSALEGVNSSFQFSVIVKFVWYSFQSCIQVIYDIEEHRVEDGALWNPTKWQVTNLKSLHSL